MTKEKKIVSMDDLYSLVNTLKRLTKTLSDIGNRPERIGNTTYQNTEKILYGYPVLDTEIRLLEEQIERFTKDPAEFDHTYGRKSKDVARFSGGGMETLSCLEVAHAGFERAIELLDEKKRNFERLIETVNKIENDDWFGVIELYYFQGKSDDEAAKVIGTYQKAVNRNRKRLVKQLEWIIFGMKCIE